MEFRYSDDVFTKAFEDAGAMVTNISEGYSTTIIEGIAIAENGEGFDVAVGTNGCLRIEKPNRTVKMYYHKTPKQVTSIIKQVSKSYK